jgi:hypothetical protein
MRRYKSYFKEKQELFYNYRRNKKQLDEPVIFCVDNPESSSHYGNIQRIFKATRKTLDLRNKNNPKVKQLVKYCQDFLNEWLEVERLNEPKVSFIAGYNAINPKDIVDSAGAWDNIEFINYLYDETDFFNKHDGVITNDGAVFFEVTKDNLVSMTDLSD